MPNEGRTTGFQTKSIQGLEQIGGRGKHMRKGWTHSRLENAAIKVRALPKTPDAVFRGDSSFFREQCKDWVSFPTEIRIFHYFKILSL